MRRIQFNPEINLGHLVQLFGGLLVLLGFYYAMDKRVTLVEQISAAHTAQITSLVASVDQNTRTLIRVVTLMDQDRNQK